MINLRETWTSGLRAYGVAALLLGVLPAASMLAPAPAAAEQAPAAELQQAVAALRAIPTLRADFTQTDATGQRVSGVLTLKRPGKIRFQYAPGYPMLIVADGHALTMLDTELNQMQRWPIGNSPLGALLDPARDVTRYGTVLPDFEPGMLAIEVRDRGHPEYGTLTLIFLRKPSAPGGLELTGWIAQDAQNRRTTVRLANHHYGVPAGDELFRLLNPQARPHH
jgi:outer membrane lipoprotein-sorting protein